MPSHTTASRSNDVKPHGFLVSARAVPMATSRARFIACALVVVVALPQVAAAQGRGGFQRGGGLRSLVNRTRSPRGGNQSQNSSSARARRNSRSTQDNQGTFRDRYFDESPAASQPKVAKPTTPTQPATTASAASPAPAVAKTSAVAPAGKPTPAAAETSAAAVTQAAPSPPATQITEPVAVETALPPAAANSSGTVPTTALPATAVPGVAVTSGATKSGGSADLVLEDIALAEPATLVAGPAYRVKFRNQGTLAAGTFRVALVATVLGDQLPLDERQLVEVVQTLAEDSPRGGTDVSGLAAGKVAEVTVRLPRSAMRMVNGSSSRPAPFTHLVVAVDPEGAISEQDKLNNVVKLDRAELDEATK